MSVTMKEVAAKAGVSISTVSKVINNSPVISPATAAQVQAVIQELGYQPNTQARNFVRQETNHILFLSVRQPHIAFNDPHMFEIMSGVEEAVSKKGYTLGFKLLEQKEDATEYIRTVVARKSADGIILHGATASKESTQLLIQTAFPYIIIGKPRFITQASWIDTNNYLSGQICGDYLIRQNFSRIAFIGGLRSDNIFKQRLYGFLQAMREHNLSVPDTYIKYGEPTKEGGYTLTDELLRESRPEAIICTNNFVALGVLKAIQAHNLRIPEDITYICFDEYPLARTMDPQPVIVAIDVYDLGLQAGSLLMQRFKNPSLQVQTHSTIPRIVQPPQRLL